jgi:hypothetical protein
MIELLEKRTHNTKTFLPNENNGNLVLQVGASNYHFYDGATFNEITPLPFPEGKVINSESDLDMVDIPEWGEARLEDNGSVVRIYDKLNIPIYRFHSPVVVKNDDPLFKVVSEGKEDELVRLEDLTSAKETIKTTESIVVIEENIIERPLFEIVGDKIRFKLSKEITEPLQAYDDTDTTSTNNKDATIASNAVNSNFGTANSLGVCYLSTSKQRRLVNFTLPSVSGTISLIKYYMNANGVSGDFGTRTLNIHQITQTSWTESGVTWNKYDGTNNWATAGGDFSGTVIDTFSSSTTGWHNWTIQGTGADNPLSLSFGDSVHLLVKDSAEDSGSGDRWKNFDTKEDSTPGDRPYLEITYTPGGTPAFTPKIIMF